MAMNSMYQQLMRLPLFQGVSAEKITGLVEKLPFHFLKYRNGETVLSAGDPCTHIKFIVSGRMRVVTPFVNLRISLSQSLESPHVLAAEYLFGRNTVYPFTGTAEGNCGILQLRKSDYIKMVNSDKVFLFNILNYLSTGSQSSLSSVVAVKDGSVAERLALQIESLTSHHSSNIVLHFKQKDLCTLLCTQRTTLISTLDKLSEEGIIEYDSNNLVVLDRHALMLRIKS